MTKCPDTIPRRSRACRRFDVPSPAALEWFNIELLRDDGAVVHLNSEEVWRDNVPLVIPLSSTNHALATVSGSDENRYLSLRLPSRFLRSGINVLAVEVHQDKPTSPDLHFDLQLKATEASIPALTFAYARNGPVLLWPASAGYELQSATDLTPPADWLPVTAPSVMDAGTNSFAVTLDAPQLFYRLWRK